MTKLKEDFEASGGVWKEWRIGELFEQFRGKEKAPNQNLDGDCQLINETSTNNGYTRKVIPTKIFGGNAITISINYASTVFYQPKDFCASVNIAILKNNEFLNEFVGNYVVAFLKKQYAKYTYSEKISKELICGTIVSLPTFNNSLALDYMEQYISLLEEEKMLQVDKFLKDSGLNDTTLTAEETDALERFRKGEVKFVERKIGELFDIKKGKRLTKANMKPGMTNFLGAISNNNGIREQIEAPFTWKPNCISVNYNGSVGYSFYQEYEFYASDDVNLCYAKDWPLDKYIALYFCAIFFKYSNVFNFGFKWSKEKMEESIVKVPVTLSNIPDFGFMQHFISAQEKLIIRGVVKYKDEVLNADGKALDFAVAAEPISSYGQKLES